MQGLLVDKIHLFKFPSISDKAGLDQLKIITTDRSAMLFEFIHAYSMPIRKVEYLVLRKCAKYHRLNQAHQ